MNKANKGILYDGVWLMQGSEAYTLLTDPPKDPSRKTIKQHMKELDAKQLKLEGVITRGFWCIGQAKKKSTQ